MNALSSPAFFKKIFLSVLVLYYALVPAQTPQWNWARSAGGTVAEDLRGNHSTINLDSAGNVYELVNSTSGSISFGTFNFTNPNGATPSNSGLPLTYFIKYSAQGTVLWAKQYRNGPGGYVIPGPNSMFVRPDGTAYLHFSMTQDSIVVGNKVAYNSAIGFSNPGACIAQYDAAGNVVRLSTFAKPYGGWTEIMPLPNNQMLGLTSIGNADTINNIPVSRGALLAILDSTGNVLKIKSLGYDSNSVFYTLPVINNGRYIALNQRSIYLMMTPSVNVHFNQSVIPFDSAYAGQLLVKLDTGLNFIWAKPVDKHFGYLIGTDELDNVYLPLTAQSKDTITLDTIVVPFPFRYQDHFYYYLGLAKLNGDGAGQWVDTILMATPGGGGVYSVCADRLGNSYLLGRFSAPTYIGPDTLQNGGNVFIAKYKPNGDFDWVQTTENGSRMTFTYNCMAEDGHGNVYINGGFADVNVHLFFGNDSLVVHPPINSYPLAADVFVARLGACNPVPPNISASSALSWCGKDSVQLVSSTANTYLWNNTDTTQTTTINTSGIYSVYGIDTLGCYAQSKPDTITTYLQPVIHATIQDVLCKGSNDGHITLQTDSTTGTVNYVFSPPVATTAYFAAGTYAITATDSVGCTATDTVTVNEPANALSVRTTYYPASQGDEGFAVATATGGTPGYTFNWQPVSVLSDTLKNPSEGLYTVTVLDSNGCSVTDSLIVPRTTGIQNITSQQSISIYPNPSTGSFYLETPVAGEMKIYNELGAAVHQQIIQSGKSRMESNALPKGIYLVEIISGSDKYKSQLIIQ